MHIEVDQSGKIGTTQVATVVALSNGKHYAILIPARVKRACLEFLKTRYRELRQPYMKLFAAALFLLLKPYVKTLQQVSIDREYPGHEGTIKGMLLNYIRREVPDFPKERIVFTEIGKESPAHEKAYTTYTGKVKPDHTVREEELIGLVGK
jgi:hypothetical protein